MLKASKATTFTVPVKVLFLGDVLNLEVQPIVQDDPEYKEEMERRAPLSATKRKELVADGEDVPPYSHEDYDYGISRVVTKWDYLDDDGQPLPITEPIVGAMPWQLKLTIWDAILEATSPKALTQPTRGTGSARKGR